MYFPRYLIGSVLTACFAVVIKYTQIPNSGAEVFCVRSQKLHREVVCAYPEIPEVFYLRTYAETPPCAWSDFAYVPTNFTEEKSAHISRNSRKFSMAYIRRNSALCVERFCVRPNFEKLHRGEICASTHMAVIWSFCVYTQNF